MRSRHSRHRRTFHHVSSTIRRFSSTLRCCRLAVPVWLTLDAISPAAALEVSISAPSGHFPIVSTKPECPLCTPLSRRSPPDAYARYACGGSQDLAEGWIQRYSCDE